MPGVAPAEFPTLGSPEWERFAAALSRQVALLLTRLESGGDLPSAVWNGGTPVRETGKAAEYRALIQGLARTFRLPPGYAATAAWASVENARFVEAMLGQVAADQPEYVAQAIAQLQAGVPGSVTLATPNPLTAAAVTAVTSQNVVASTVGLAADASQQIAAIIQSHVISGQSIPNIASAIQDQAGVTQRARAVLIARTQTAEAYNAVSSASYQVSTQVVQWEWLATGGNRTCATCLALEGTLFPSEVQMEPHPNCRCTMIPVVGRPSITPAQVRANQAQARQSLPKSWDLPAGQDLRKLVYWSENPGWRGSPLMLRPPRGTDGKWVVSSGKNVGETRKVISLAQKQAGVTV